MIGILTPLAEAICTNCGGKITQYRSDLELSARWSHEANGMNTCPGAPTAQPVESTLVDLTVGGPDSEQPT